MNIACPIIVSFHTHARASPFNALLFLPECLMQPENLVMVGSTCQRLSRERKQALVAGKGFQAEICIVGGLASQH